MRKNVKKQLALRVLSTAALMAMVSSIATAAFADTYDLNKGSVDILAEGGFAAEEAEMAAKAGAKTVGLGPRILRCETAPLAVLSAVMTLTGNLE